MNVVNFSLGVYDALNFVRLMTDGLCCAKTLIRKWFHLKNNFNFDNIYVHWAVVVAEQLKHKPTKQEVMGSNPSWRWAFFFYSPFLPFFNLTKSVLDMVLQV